MVCGHPIGLGRKEGSSPPLIMPSDSTSPKRTYRRIQTYGALPCSHQPVCTWSEIPRDLICLQRPHTEQQSHCQLVTVSSWLHLHSSLCCRAPPMCSGQRVPSMVRKEGGWEQSDCLLMASQSPLASPGPNELALLLWSLSKSVIREPRSQSWYHHDARCLFCFFTPCKFS